MTPRHVVLVPGLWVPAAAMALLSLRLQRRGHEVHVFAYHGRALHDANVDALARFSRGKTGFVGHSLGGVVARIGDQLIDGSTRSKLVALKRRLETTAR